MATGPVQSYFHIDFTRGASARGRLPPAWRRQLGSRVTESCMGIRPIQGHPLNEVGPSRYENQELA